MQSSKKKLFRTLRMERLSPREVFAANPPDLVLHLPLDETAGAVANDVSGNEHDGSITGEARWKSSPLGGALELSGINSGIQIEDAPDLTRATQAKRTVAFFFRVDEEELSKNRRVLYEEGGAVRGLNVYLTKGRLHVGGWNTSESDWSGTFFSTAVHANRWYHVALVLDGGPTLQPRAFRAYLDGIPFGSGNGSQLSPRAGVSIGRPSGTTRYQSGLLTGSAVSGLIDDVRIYNRALEWSEIAFLADLPRRNLPPAFPGAVGFGANVSGGRGGDVYYVTNLLDYEQGQKPIPGSLRNGIASATGPRTIVFGVSGNLALKRALDIRKKQDLTIAGQTAPGGGVTVYGYRTEVVFSNNIIIRYLRFRTGDFNAKAVGDKAGKGRKDLSGEVGDAVEIANSRNILVDHVSTGWGMDETLSVTQSRDVTVQNSIIAESLNDSYHPKGKHGFGSLVRGELCDLDREVGTGGITFYGNLLAKHWVRVPAVSAATRPNSVGRTDFELVNNVIYDWGQSAVHTDGKASDVENLRLNFIGNYLIAGPDSVDVNSRTAFVEYVGTGTRLYHGDTNYLDADRDAVHDGKVADDGAFRRLETKIAEQPFASRLEPSDILSAPQAYDRVLASAGASLARDAHDARVVNEVQGRSGIIINSQDDLAKIAGVQALLAVSSPLPPADKDKDGMPDTWEIRQGLNPNNAADRNGKNLSTAGYTNLEVYLAGLTEGEK